MFFHHDQLTYYLQWIEKLMALFQRKTFTDRQHVAQYYHVEPENERKIRYFANNVLPRLALHVRDVNKHINKKDLARQVHHYLIDKVIVPMLKDQQMVSQEENELQGDLRQLYKLHQELLPVIERAERYLAEKETYYNRTYDALRDLGIILKKVHELSIKTGRVMKDLLSRTGEVEELLKREREHIKSFRANLKSWIHVVEE